jgi:hypothetical protein
MFKRSDLEELAAVEGDYPVVSLYLNMAPHMRSKGSQDAYRARLKTLLKEVSGRAPETDLSTVEEFFEKEFDWVGRSVAVFCGGGGDLWQVERFAVPIRSTIHVGSKPFITPLANVIDTYGSYAVALIDQQTIRMFYIHLGDLVAWEKEEGASVQRLKTGSGSSQGGSRGDHLQDHTDEQVRGNLRTFADKLATFCNHYNVEHLLLGGPEPTVQQFKGTLPTSCKNRVESTVALSVRAPESEVREQSLAVMQANEKARDAKLVERVMALAAQGGNGTVGKKETLEALEAGRVDTLVLVDGELPPNEADPAINKAVDFGGKVTFVDEDSPLAKEGGLGALLRY